MNIKGKIKRAKAISPIIATIILIVLTVVAGGFVYIYAMGMLHTGAANEVVNVQSDTIVIPSGSNYGTWSVTLQNAGTVGITSVNLTTYTATTPSTKLSFLITNIAPGATATGTIGIPPTGTPLAAQVTAGQTLTVSGLVTYANGAKSTISTSVTVGIF